MTRIASLFCLCILLGALCACSDDKKATADDDTAPVDTDTATDDLLPGDGDELLNDDDGVAGNPLFNKGPYGVKTGDTAGGFTVPTDDGDWDFEKNWDGKENYVFIFYRNGSTNAAQLWQSQIVMLLLNSPKNVHYFFIAGVDDDKVDATLQPLIDKIDEAKGLIDDPKYWAPRLHMVRKGARNLGNWISDWYNGTASFVMGVDRFQKIRGTGSLMSWQNQQLEFEMVGYEAAHWDFQFEREQKLAAEADPLILTGIDGKEFESETITFEVEFPAAAEMTDYTGLAVDFEQICASQAACEWDRIMHLYICGPDDTDTCGTEVARWITAYGMGGRWVTDITPLMPLFAGGGTLKFRLYVWGYQAKNYLSFRLTAGGDPAPTGIKKLFAGNPRFDENYNTQYAPLTLELPAGVKKAAIAAFITGHGNGSEQANCAEFCPFESVFVVNGTNFEKDHPLASTNDGCAQQVTDGVIPNQYGSWPFGRAGWCPGLNVSPWVKEVTDAIVSGENTFAFEAYLDGKDYVPVVTAPDGYRAEINSSSYLVWWE
ncbi:MAG TPA: peptide-N-glycosidase F-related protein [bacterium]|nr:peptide-N-glycosidase F-related protein [bacterium]